MGPGTETLTNSYDPAQFQAFAIDVWDGASPQVNIFAVNAGISYPILMFGGGAGILSAYNCNYDYFFIIGGDGLIKWRGIWNQTAITTAINNAITDLAPAAIGDVPSSTTTLLTNYPNPFNPSTRIAYELTGDATTVTVRLEILDMRGRLVKTLVQDRQATGQRHEAVWDGHNEKGRPMPSGTYLYRLQVNGKPYTKFMTLVK